MRNYTFHFFVITLMIMVGTSQNGRGQVLLYDNFNYPAGDSLIWHNWITQQTNLTNAILVSDGGLSYTNYPCSGIGNAAEIGTTGQDVFRGFVKQTAAGSTLYMAFLVNVTSAATGDCFITFKESATSPTNVNFRGRAYAKAGTDNNIAFGISKGAISAPASADYTPAVYSLNTTYLLVVKYKIIEGANNDSAFLFVNPVIGDPEPAPTVVATDMTPSDLGLGSVLLRQGTTGSSPTVIVDGVRVSKHWQQVLLVSDISTLSDLKVDNVTVGNFNPDVLVYNDTVPAGQTAVTVTATSTDWAASVEITTAPSIPGISTVLVTAENGNNSTTYTINHAYAYYNVDLSVAPPSSGTVTGGGVYGEGFDATVTATPAADYLFLNWTENGVIVSSSSEYTFTVTENRSLVANFVPAFYNITATVDPVGTVTGTGTYGYGDDATLTAIPDEGYEFVEWTEGGDIIGSDEVLIIQNITSDHYVVAHFVLQTLMVTTIANPVEGGTITGGGTYPYGDEVTVTATPATDYIFLNWTEDGIIVSTSSVYNFIITENTSLVANFVPAFYEISAIAEPIGTIAGTGIYGYGDDATLTAIPNEGYDFVEWTEGGEIIGSDEVLIIENITSDHDVIAYFVLQTLMVTTSANPTEGGTITGGGEVSYGFDVTLIATPNDGYIFENWTEDGTILGTDPVLILLDVTTDRYIVGNFIESTNTFTVSASANPPEGGAITGTGNVPLGGSITLIAITNHPDYEFENWTEDGIILGTDTSITLINVSENHYLIANFISHVGIVDVIDSGIRIYPTLTSGLFHVESDSDIKEIIVFNLLGQEIINLILPSREVIIDAAGWQKGSYIVKMIGSKGSETRKVIIY